MNQNNITPRARIENIVVQDFENEILIYDLKLDKAFALNKTASAIYPICDGKTTINELKIKTQFTDEIIFLTLDELKKENLIEDNSYISPFGGFKRREVIKKIGLASMVALPVISSIVAPHAIQSASNSTCPLGMITNPTATQGRDNNCGCGTNVGNGNSCGTGTTFDPASTCRTGCLCRATSCPSISNTCAGLCE